MRRAAALLVVIPALAACGSSPDTTAAPTDPQAIVDLAADAMGSIESARFTMERGGAPIEISGMEFVSAEGQYAAPDSARALLTVKAGDLSVELGTIAIGDTIWLTNPLTSEWEELNPGTGFNPAVVFDPDSGWVPLLTDDLEDISHEGMENAGSGPRHRIHGTIAERRIAFLTAGLVGAQAVEADLWIDAESYRIARVDFETVGEAGTSTWVIEMSDFDAPVEIGPPGSGE